MIGSHDYDPAARDRRVDGIDHLLAAGVPGHQALSARSDQGRDHAMADLGRQQEHLGGWRGGPDRGRRRDRVAAGQVGIQQQHTRPVLGGQSDARRVSRATPSTARPSSTSSMSPSPSAKASRWSATNTPTTGDPIVGSNALLVDPAFTCMGLP
jgi:hypothetical protein